MPRKQPLPTKPPKMSASEALFKALESVAHNPEAASHLVVRESVLHMLDGIRKTTRDELVDRGEYPPPAKASESGRARIWFLSDIFSWQEERKRLRDVERAGCAK